MAGAVMTQTITLHITPPAGKSLLWAPVEKVLKPCKASLNGQYRECEYDHEMTDGLQCFEWATLRSLKVPAPMVGVVKSEYATVGREIEEMGAFVEIENSVVESAA